MKILHCCNKGVASQVVRPSTTRYNEALNKLSEPKRKTILLSELKNLHSSGKLSFDHDLIYNASGQASEFKHFITGSPSKYTLEALGSLLTAIPGSIVTTIEN